MNQKSSHSELLCLNKNAELFVFVPNENYFPNYSNFCKSEQNFSGNVTLFLMGKAHSSSFIEMILNAYNL